jgi:hypothetical protein
METRQTLSEASALFRKLANGGKPENPDEALILDKIGTHLDKGLGKYECPTCALKRMFDLKTLEKVLLGEVDNHE